MNYRLTPAQLEAMTTHEVAELLANMAVLLRRMPDMPFRQFMHLSEEVQREQTEAITAESSHTENA